MSELADLYQEVILDHNKRPRNFHRLDDANRTAEGFNPLCGDQIQLFVKLEDGVIRDIAFQGSGCAISKASASLMTSILKGKTEGEAASLFERFHELVTAEHPCEDPESLGKLAVFSGVREFPARVKCASLAWHTLRAALEGRKESARTE
jgi:nitrogen fixation protein NifU and related proteins